MIRGRDPHGYNQHRCHWHLKRDTKGKEQRDHEIKIAPDIRTDLDSLGLEQQSARHKHRKYQTLLVRV